MTDDAYIARELNKARPVDEELERPAIKVRGPGGESHWVIIPAERFAAVVAAASTPAVASFNLFIVYPDGRTRKTLRSPYDSRAGSIRTVRMIVEGTTGYEGKGARSFAEEVAAAPLGETVMHPTLGIGFRTEEV